FQVAQASLDKFPGWSPKVCRACKPVKKAAGARRSRGGGGGGGGGRGRGRGRSAGGVEENLTLAQVRERYSDGPMDGIFTDGGCSPNPGPGGWGMVWVEGGEVREQLHGTQAKTTNNQMELQALIEAHKALPEDAVVTIYTDSKLCVDTITKWAPNWERNGWTKKSGEIKNLERVQELLALHRARKGCTLQWIAAHSGNLWNEYADSLSSAWRRDEL
ncbi:MAG: ribonuclease HI, partial [Planctomycetota bacterium]